MSVLSYRTMGILLTLCTIPPQTAKATPTWTGLGGSITGKIQVINVFGNLHAFARGTDNALWTNAQSSTDGPWSGWTSLGGVLSSDPAVDIRGPGVLEVFVLGSDGSLWSIAQTTANGPFGDWRGLGGNFVSNPAVIRDTQANLHVFVVGVDHSLWTNAETSSTSTGSFGSWTSMGGVILHNPAVIMNGHFCSGVGCFVGGSIEVFAIGTDNAVWHNWTVDNAFNWSGWSSLGGSAAGSPVAAVNTSNGLVEVAATGTDASLWYTTHLFGSADWTPFASLGGYLTSDPVVVFDGIGSVEMFARGGDNGVWYITGTAPSTFGNWATLGGVINNSPAAVTNGIELLNVFVEGTDTAMWGIEQSSRGSWQSSGCTPTALTPYLQVDSGYWQQTASASVTAGSTVNLGPQPAVWGGSWSWTGPGGFTSNQREIDGIPLSAGSNTFVGTYVDPNSCSSNLTFVITE